MAIKPNDEERSFGADRERQREVSNESARSARPSNGENAALVRGRVREESLLASGCAEGHCAVALFAVCRAVAESTSMRQTVSLNTQRRPLADTSKAATLMGKSKVVGSVAPPINGWREVALGIGAWWAEPEVATGSVGVFEQMPNTV